MVLTRSQSLKLKSASVVNPFSHHQHHQHIDKQINTEEKVKFPVKLWNMVESERVKSIEWRKNGKAIGIDPRELQYELRMNFLGLKTDNFNSFIRQLNYYRFRKTNCETDYLEYEHPFFSKDKSLLSKVKRKKLHKNNDDETDSSSVCSSIKVKEEVTEFGFNSEFADHSTNSRDPLINDKEVNQDNRSDSYYKALPRCFGSFYIQFAYYGKCRRKDDSYQDYSYWDKEFAEDSPVGAYSF